MPKPIPLTPAIALAHERLYPRVTALLKQVERSAARHPQHPVPTATLLVVRPLLGEARKILGREAMQGAGSATGDLSALALGLSQLVAQLEAFEAEHSGFSAKAKCVVWRVGGPSMPVTRLKPAGVETGPKPVNDRRAEETREQLMKLIAARFVAGYDEGYRDAQEGKPPSSRYAETVWDAMVKLAGGGDEAARLRLLEERYGTTTPPPHLMPIGAKPGEWQRIEEERAAIAQAERLARQGGQHRSE